MEITTLREDVETDGRRAIVKFGTSFEKDAERRDFTINAMFEDIDGNVYDYFLGRKDIESRVLRFVGDPSLRIQEDYLRILRFYRFWARFRLNPDPEALKAIKHHKDGLKIVSIERITSEIFGLLAEKECGKALESLIEFQLLDPWIQIVKDKSVEDLTWPKNAQLDRELLVLVRLVWLTNPTSDPRGISKQLRLSTAQAKIVEFLSQHLEAIPQSSAPQSEHLFYLDRMEKVFPSIEQAHLSFLALDPKLKRQVEHQAKVEREKGHLRSKKMAVNGHILQEKLSLKGHQIGEVLNQLKEDFYNELWSSEEDGLARAKFLCQDSSS